jgi:outer membrane receptor protein involved in Fe transport
MTPFRHRLLASLVSRPRAWFALLLLLGKGTAGLSAQETTPTASAPASASAGEVVTVPEFEVTGTQQRDAWVASQAMSGTRTNSAIIDLPYQVQVLTQEFLDDFQLVSLSDQLSYFTGYSSVASLADAAIGGTQAGSMLRGFPQTIVRDGFRRTPPPGIGNTAQVEVIKGPISTLYGDAAPGGLINYVSKRPTARPQASLTLSGGSYDYFRSNVFASGPVVGQKLFILASADNYYRKGETQYTYARNGDYVFTALYRPFASTSISVNYEAVRLIGARAATLPSLVVGTRPSGTNPLSWTGGVVVGIDWRLARLRYSRFGPNEHYERDYDGINVLIEHAYSRNWKQRISYQGQWKHFELLYRTNSNVSAETNRMTAVEPNERFQDITSPVSLQSDLLGQFKTGPLSHALLFTADYARERTRDWQVRLPTAAAAALPDSYRYQDPFNPDWTPFDYGLLTRRAAKNYENMRSAGGSVSDRVFLPGNRVILMGNVRYDRATFDEDASATVDAFTHGKADGTTTSFGANVKVIGDDLVLFANRSTSFNTNPTVDRNQGTTIPNERGRGYEFGFKSLALDQRLGVTVSGYQIEKTNIGQSNPDFVLGNGLPEFLGSGKERVRGVDGDVSYKLSNDFTFILGASYLDPRVTASTNAALRNTRKINVPETTGSIATRYKFSGALKGFSLGTSFRYTGSYVRANATATRAYEEAAPRQIYSAFLAYTWKDQRLTHTVRLNGENIFDKFYVGPDLNLALGRQINVTYSLAFR